MTSSSAARFARKKIIQEIDDLIRIAAAERKSDPASAIRRLDDALELVQKHRTRKVLGELYQIYSKAYWTMGDLGKAAAFAKQSLACHEANGNRAGVAMSLFYCGSVAGMNGETEQALTYLGAALQQYQSLEDKVQEANTLGNMGTVYFRQAEYAPALDCFLRSLALQEAIGNDQVHYTFGNIALVYQRMHDYTAALEYFQKSLALSPGREDEKDRQHKANTLCNIGHLHLEQARYPAASEMYHAALSMAAQHGFKGIAGEVYHGLGTAAFLTGDMAAAEQDLRQSLTLFEEMQSTRWQMKNRLALGNLFAAPSPKQSRVTAMAFLQSALVLAVKIQDKQTEADCHTALSKVFEETGDLEKALRHHHEFHRLDKELFNDGANKRLREALFRLEESQTKRENERLKLEMQRREKELTMLAAMIIEKNQLVDSLKTELITLAEGNRGGASYRKMIGRIDSARDKNAAWKTFEKQFNLLHHGFLQTLASRFPKLTPTECKICALMKINLSTKEISNLLFISTRSVESYRLQVRKKLTLKPAQNLSTFLAAL